MVKYHQQAELMELLLVVWSNPPSNKLVVPAVVIVTKDFSSGMKASFITVKILVNPHLMWAVANLVII